MSFRSGFVTPASRRLLLDPEKFDGRMPALLFTDEVSAAALAHTRGMHSPGGDVAALARTIGLRHAAVRQRHFSIKYNMRGFGCVRVVGIKHVRSILPHVSMQKSFAMELALERF